MAYLSTKSGKVSSGVKPVSEDLSGSRGVSAPAVPIQQKKAIQKMEAGDDTLQGKFETAQLAAEEEDTLQGKFETAQLMEDEEPLQGKFLTAQLMEDEEPLQGKFKTVQLMEEEEPLQGKFTTAQLAAEEEDTLQGKFETAQLMEEEEPLQGKFLKPFQLKSDTEGGGVGQLEKEDNKTGLPDSLKTGVESLSGLPMNDVKVHFNSSKPSQLQAHAYAQGTDIHVAPGQEKHLPHEAWHVAQQKQGRVQATTQMKTGVPVNDDAGLEHEADVMGAKAAAQGKQIESAAQLKRLAGHHP